jgi:Uma2 family endonuclease
LWIERTADGELIVLPPAGAENARRGAVLVTLLTSWASSLRTGIVFGASIGFILPNGAERSPDVSWVRRERWESLTQAQRERFPPLCPDFVIELRSPSDAMADQDAKMREYLANGTRLGWLLDPETRQVRVYEPGHEVALLDNPAQLTRGVVLPGFALDLAAVW